MGVQRDVRVFDRDPGLYHRMRPDYPPAAVDFAVEGLPAQARALELGCGSGRATVPVLDRGLHVVAVERGPRLIDAVARRTKGRAIEFVCARFEDYEPEPAGFDLVYAAQAWHWLAPDGRNEKVARALRPDGRLAILQRFVHGNWTEGRDLYRRFWPGGSRGGELPPAEERIECMRAGIEEGGHIAVTDLRTWRQDQTFTARGYADWLATTSDHGALPDEVRQPFLKAVERRIEELGGRIVRPYAVAVFVGRVRRDHAS